MKNLKFTLDQEIGILKLFRPQVLNALNQELFLEFLHFLNLEHKIKILIITGNGEKAFSSGADILEMSQMNQKEIQDFSTLGQKVFSTLENLPLITIALVNGIAFGGGVELCLGTDFIFASDRATFSFPETTLGLIPGFGGTQKLPKLIGLRQAKDLIFSGKILSATEALKINLINGIFEHSELRNKAEEFEKTLLNKSFFALISAKRALNQGKQLSSNQGFEIEKELFSLCFQQKETKESLRSFLERHEKKIKLGKGG